jgi:hypothetical protein
MVKNKRKKTQNNKKTQKSSPKQTPSTNKEKQTPLTKPQKYPVRKVTLLNCFTNYFNNNLV